MQVNLWRMLLLSSCLLSSTPLYANNETDGADDNAPSITENACPDAELFSSKLLTDMCWSCLFPIRVAGFDIGGGHAPAGASNNVVCLCEDSAGLPQPGLVTGMWEPARLVEIVRSPGCSPALGGVTLPIGSRRQQGTHGSGEFDTGDVAFYHYHYYAFPLLMLLELYMGSNCQAEDYVDFDVLYLSEIDPTWQNDELAFFTQPEAAAVANPLALSACAADVVAANAGAPNEQLFWCAGSWGHLYPLSGHTLAAGSFAENTSQLSARVLAALHRRGLARRTLGNDALCAPTVDLMLPKTQYKMAMFFPTAENQRGHVLGESPWLWGNQGRTFNAIPGTGEDAVYVVWRWRDCCRGARRQ